MKFLDPDIAPLGLGCWPTGGEMYGADGQSLGYSKTDDEESIKAIHAALANGVTLFDTAAAYGAGHSERLLAMALANHPEAQVATKIGISIDEDTKTLTGEDVEPQSVIPAIERSLERLGRESIDLLTGKKQLEHLQTGGRSAAQGSLAWLWAKSPNNIPIPGARTVEQVEGLAAAIAFGPLPAPGMDEIALLVGSEFESEGQSER